LGARKWQTGRKKTKFNSEKRDLSHIVGRNPGTRRGEGEGKVPAQESSSGRFFEWERIHSNIREKLLETLGGRTEGGGRDLHFGEGRQRFKNCPIPEGGMSREKAH